jgi:hypothetical protein
VKNHNEVSANKQQNELLVKPYPYFITVVLKWGGFGIDYCAYIATLYGAATGIKHEETYSLSEWVPGSGISFFHQPFFSPILGVG